MSEEAAPPRRSARAARWRQPRHGHRLAFVLTLALIVVVLVSLPFALGSMRTQLFGEQTSVLYDLVSGRALTPADAAAHPEPKLCHHQHRRHRRGRAGRLAQHRRQPDLPEHLSHPRRHAVRRRQQRRGAPGAAPLGDGDAAHRPTSCSCKPSSCRSAANPASIRSKPGGSGSA